MESRQNLDAEEDRTMDMNSVQSVDDVIRAITGQSPRQSVDEIIGAVTELLEVELGRNPNGNRSPTHSSSSAGMGNNEFDPRIPEIRITTSGWHAKIEEPSVWRKSATNESRWDLIFADFFFNFDLTFLN